MIIHADMEMKGFFTNYPNMMARMFTEVNIFHLSPYKICILWPRDANISDASTVQKCRSVNILYIIDTRNTNFLFYFLKAGRGVSGKNHC